MSEPSATLPPAPPTPATPPPASGATVTSGGPAATQALGAGLAQLLQPGDVVLLGGGLGAGKTTFTQGVARALGVTDVVTSPTFTLVREYATAGGFPLLHADVYRLEQLQEVIDLALPDQLEDGACALIEWGERAAPALAPDYLSISFDYGEAEADRVVTLHPVGAQWAARFPDVVATLHGIASPPETASVHGTEVAP